MARNKVMVHTPYLSRVAAIFLALIIMLQLGVPVTMAESQSLLDRATPVVFYEGTPIYDGMEIAAESPVYVYYNFPASRSELAGAEETVTLPDRLVTSGGLWTKHGFCEPDGKAAMAVWGTDTSENYFEVGALTSDDEGNVKAM